MTDLEKFKAWAAEHQTMDGYPQYTPFDAWQASRRAALEESAGIVDAEAENARQEHYYPGVVGMLEESAAAIRALVSGDEN